MHAQNTIDALVTSVEELDRSRRVGWAVSYDRKEKLDSALHDLNIARGDSDIYRSVASYLLGYVQAIEARLPEWPGSETRRTFISAADFIADVSSQAEGRNDGAMASEHWRRTMPDLVALNQAKAERAKANKSVGRDFRDAMRSLADQYHMTPSEVREILRRERDARKKR